ncbi:hypothetical protein C0992_006110 [Termitomyces sp. T32_za158]|nr:hypothetical protein C0992_006110 [Termitomyces sp. T32_za158]
MSNTAHSILDLPDGAKIAYEVLGTQFLGSRQPLVLIGGMSSRRIDWERLASSLSRVRPMNIRTMDRGMGDSQLSPGKDERITLESLAHDLLALLVHLQWKDLSLCGFSMGGLCTAKQANVPDRQLTLDEKKEMARGTLESTFDPAWLANPENSQRFQWWLERMVSGGR